MKYFTLSFFLLVIKLLGAKPSVILILADDMGVGGLGCYGNTFVETPNIDSLAKGGLRFTNGISNYPTCKPSRAAILSGKYGSKTGVVRVSNKHIGSEELIKWDVPKCLELKSTDVSMGKVMKDSGYHTASYGKWHVSNHNKPEGHPTAFGFDDALVSASTHYGFSTVPEVEVPKDLTSTEFFTQKALDFIEEKNDEEDPFFLYLPFYLVHAPFTPKAEDLKYFKNKMKEESDEQVIQVAAMTKMLDDCVGRIINKLKQLNSLEDTFIIFTSDNGSYNTAFNLNFREKKGQLYEGGVRVPYIFHWPNRIKPETTSSERIAGIDLVSTFVELTGYSDKSLDLDGVSLLPLLKGDITKLEERSLFCYYPKYARFNKNTERWGDSWRHSIYQGQFKLIEYPEYGEVELFDLKQDPEESQDMSARYPEKSQKMVQELHKWLDSCDVLKRSVNKNYSLKD